MDYWYFWIQELQIQLEKMKIEKITRDEERKNLLSVIGTLEKNMEGMRQDQGKLQRVLWELQQENTALKSHHQQQQQVEEVLLDLVVATLTNIPNYTSSAFGRPDLLFSKWSTMPIWFKSHVTRFNRRHNSNFFYYGWYSIPYITPQVVNK